MVFESRYPAIDRSKQRIVLDSRFSFFKVLDIGDVGQIKATIVVEAIELSPDDEGNEFKNTTYKIVDAKLANNKVSM